LAVALFFWSHFFACIWMLLGSSTFAEETGWVYANVFDGYQSENYWDIYITSVYWCITTFTSIGYGDVTGDTTYEYLFQIFIEMVGIAFYGYMIGTFQNLFEDMRSNDQVTE